MAATATRGFQVFHIDDTDRGLRRTTSIYVWRYKNSVNDKLCRNKLVFFKSILYKKKTIAYYNTGIILVITNKKDKNG
jgi:hypothetical protein